MIFRTLVAEDVFFWRCSWFRTPVKLLRCMKLLFQKKMYIHVYCIYIYIHIIYIYILYIYILYIYIYIYLYTCHIYIYTHIVYIYMHIHIYAKKVVRSYINSCLATPSLLAICFFQKYLSCLGVNSSFGVMFPALRKSLKQGFKRVGAPWTRKKTADDWQLPMYIYIYIYVNMVYVYIYICDGFKWSLRTDPPFFWFTL